MNSLSSPHICYHVVIFINSFHTLIITTILI
jgi:hypothetical protein